MSTACGSKPTTAHRSTSSIRRAACRSRACPSSVSPRRAARSTPAAKAGPAWRALTAAQRAAILRAWHDLMLEHADDLARIMTAEQGKPLAEAKGRNHLCGLVSRVVRRGGQGSLWRHDPVARRRQADHRDQGADRRLRGNHPVEFPRGNDHTQGRARARRGLHDRRQACRGDPALRVCARACPNARACPRAC